MATSRRRLWCTTALIATALALGTSVVAREVEGPISVRIDDPATITRGTAFKLNGSARIGSASRPSASPLSLPDPVMMAIKVSVVFERTSATIW